MPKVRSGCATCKIRRIKCDEQKPKCLRCVRSDRDCMGYDYLERGQQQQQQQQQQPGAIKIYNIPFKIPGSQTQRQMLHFYCCEAAACLSKFSDPTLWTQLILQRSQHQPVIRNALVALSSLYRDYLSRGPSPLGESPMHIEAIAKSHRQLRLHLHSRDDASPETALICSLIFYIFECLVGNAGQAIWHLDQGLMLLQRCRTEDPRRISSNSKIYAHLTAVFSHLDVHASVFNTYRAPILKLASPGVIAGVEFVVPECFSSLAHAEEALTMLQNWMMHHLIASIEYKNNPWNPISPEFLHEILQLRRQFQWFVVATEKLALDVDTTIPQQQQQQQQERIILLQIQAHSFHGVLLQNITHRMPQDLVHMPTQSYSQFNKALTLVATLLRAHQAENPLSSNPGFTLSTNLIAALYYICLKTNHRRILQTALSLLRDSPFFARDGLWDAGKAVSVVQAMMTRWQVDGEGSELDLRLEYAGCGILDNVDGLDGAFKMLQIAEKSSWN